VFLLLAGGSALAQAAGNEVSIQQTAPIELRALLAQDGVLDRLRARGFTVTAPDAHGRCSPSRLA
jgi:hypothetical protein